MRTEEEILAKLNEIKVIHKEQETRYSKDYTNDKMANYLWVIRKQKVVLEWVLGLSEDMD